MATQREANKAFAAAVEEMVAFLDRRGGRLDKVQKLAERYERLSGLSRKDADNKIIAEAERRRKKSR